MFLFILTALEQLVEVDQLKIFFPQTQGLVMRSYLGSKNRIDYFIWPEFYLRSYKVFDLQLQQENIN